MWSGVRGPSAGRSISNVARRASPGMKNAPAYTGTRGGGELYAGASVVGGRPECRLAHGITRVNRANCERLIQLRQTISVREVPTNL
jgi:hypothetical protein